MILPTVISNSPFLADVTVSINSGRDVPITIAVIVIVFSLIPIDLAIKTALSTITSLLIHIITIDNAKIVIAIKILSYLISTDSSASSIALPLNNCTRYATNIKNNRIKTIPSALEKTFGVFVLKILSNIRTLNDVVTSNKIGISFFTFQAVTYMVDVYRGDAKAQKSYWNLLLYISMFPQLIAGPIVRYSDIDEQINNRKESMQGFINGMFRFSVGLGKKVIFANYAGNIATSLLVEHFDGISTKALWIGIIMFTVQLYFDFSGYSDMAIGLGKVFGFDYKENFNYPYMANSISDFWKRWHISLGSFFRDYVYIPLGGNTCVFKYLYCMGINRIMAWSKLELRSLGTFFCHNAYN